jgi:hypothetical protein
MATDVDRLLQQFESVYANKTLSLNYIDTDIKRAMARELLMVLDLLEKAEQNQSSGYMRKPPKKKQKYTTTVYPDAIDDSWIKTGVSHD